MQRVGLSYMLYAGVHRQSVVIIAERQFQVWYVVTVTSLVLCSFLFFICVDTTHAKGLSVP